MRGLSHNQLLELGAQILLCNTYHLHLHPGEDTVAAGGGLHGFVHWEKPILTDSGGYQVYSLRHRSQIQDDGVTFKAPNGEDKFLSPEIAMEIQFKLGADIIMCFDDCPPATGSKERIEKATSRSIAWAERCKKHHTKLCKQHNRRPLLFGIVQGGLHDDLRTHCAKAVAFTHPPLPPNPYV